MGKKSVSQISPAITVIGSGEAFDRGIGNTSYLLRGRKLPSVLFDCGYQIPERLWSKALHADLDAVCFTHLHADHSFGIVPLLVRFAEEGRTKPLHILGPRGTDRFVSRLLDMGYPGFAKRISFDIRFVTLSTSSATQFRGLRLTCARTVHSILNFTIRVDLPGRLAAFAVSGDGQITPETKRLVSDVCVLFQEIYSEAPGIPVHADLATIRAWIPETSIKILVASHFARSSEVNRQRLQY
jgi:ribonuclease BN (tRNA processing enzyme)